MWRDRLQHQPLAPPSSDVTHGFRAATEALRDSKHWGAHEITGQRFDFFNHQHGEGVHMLTLCGAMKDESLLGQSP